MKYPPMSEQDKETLFLLMQHQYQTYAEAIRLGFSKERTAAYGKTIRDFYDAGWNKILNSGKTDIGHVYIIGGAVVPAGIVLAECIIL